MFAVIPVFLWDYNGNALTKDSVRLRPCRSLLFSVRKITKKRTTIFVMISSQIRLVIDNDCSTKLMSFEGCLIDQCAWILKEYLMKLAVKQCIERIER